MLIGYGFVYYDKAVLNNAVLFDMTDDLSLSVVDTVTSSAATVITRSSWASSIFYFKMHSGHYPMTFILQRFQVGKVPGILVIILGMIAMLTAAVSSWRGLFAQRFLLGFVDSLIPPASTCTVSGCYTQKEQALGQSSWTSFNGGWTISGAASNYGFAQITGGSLACWQYTCLLAGPLTVIFGVICSAVPNSAVTAWFLSPEERIVERIQTGVRCEKLKPFQIGEAVLGIEILLVVFMMAGA